jgi:hypothetical protein
MDGRAFAGMIFDNFDDMLRHAQRAPQHVNTASKRVWFTTPGSICTFMGGKRNGIKKA